LTGTKLNAGKLVMGKLHDGSRVSFDIEDCHDIDRRIQSKMYEQPALKKWGIFFCE
jgi:hypothetical protein